MDQLDVELDVQVDDLMVLRDVRRVDLLLLTAVVEFSLEVDGGLLLLLDYLLVRHFQWMHCLLGHLLLTLPRLSYPEGGVFALAVGVSIVAGRSLQSAMFAPKLSKVAVAMG